MRKKLTQSDFENIPPCPDGTTRIEYCDISVPGLYLEVRATSPHQGTLYLRYKTSVSKTTAHKKIGTTQELTLKQARDRARQLKAKIALGADPQADTRQRKAVPTWDAFFEADYLPHAKQKKRTWKNDADMHRCRISERFGKTSIDRIGRQAVEQFHSELREQGLAPATADHYLKLIRHALNLAVDWGLIESNPAAKVRQFNEDNQVERYLSDAELRRLMAVLRDYENRPMACIVLWLLATGARAGESRAATWEDIDYDARVWVIRSQSSKSKRRRSVPLNDIALSVLDELKDAGGQSGPLFKGKRGPYRHLNRNWARICEAANLQGLRLHDLRHSYASMLVNAGHSLYEVQQALGHSDPKVTMRYSHLTKETLQKAADSAAERIRSAME